MNGYDTQLYIYDLNSKEVTPITKDFNPAVSNYIWHTDGNIYIVAGDTDYVYLFRYGKDGKITRIECPGDLVQKISLAQNGNTGIYTASDESYPDAGLYLGACNPQMHRNGPIRKVTNTK